MSGVVGERQRADLCSLFVVRCPFVRGGRRLSERNAIGDRKRYTTGRSVFEYGKEKRSRQSILRPDMVRSQDQKKRINEEITPFSHSLLLFSLMKREDARRK